MYEIIHMSIVITGNPGVGKHTITNEVIKKLELQIIDINKIVKNSELFEKDQDGIDVDITILREILKKESFTGKIVVGHLAPYVLDETQIKIVIILRRSPYDLIQVYKQRKYTDEKCNENLGSEILGVIAHDTIERFGQKAFQIDTSDKDISNTIKKVLDIISNNGSSDKVDWLGLVTENNDLEKFFVD